MDRSKKERLAEVAASIGRSSRTPGAPVLAADSDVDAVAAWLQWNDPNGCHTRTLAALEGIEPYEGDDVWDALANALEDDEGEEEDTRRADNEAARRLASIRKRAQVLIQEAEAQERRADQNGLQSLAQIDDMLGDFVRRYFSM